MLSESGGVGLSRIYSSMQNRIVIHTISHTDVLSLKITKAACVIATNLLLLPAAPEDSSSPSPCIYGASPPYTTGTAPYTFQEYPTNTAQPLAGTAAMHMLATRPCFTHDNTSVFPRLITLALQVAVRRRLLGYGGAGEVPSFISSTHIHTDT